jgi:tetratricopeptide (TPR) repeat protein
LAPDEALRWYRDALDLLDRAPANDPYRRAELLVGLGNAQRQTGNALYRETLLTAAHLADELDEVGLLVRAVLLNSRGIVSSIGEIDHERIEVITRTLERLGDADSPDRARLLALLCLERTFDADPDGRMALASQAIEIARRTGNRSALVDAIAMCHEAITMPPTLELRREWTSEACVVVEDLGDPIARLVANQWRMYPALEAGDLEAMDDAASIWELEAARIQQPYYAWQVAVQRALRYLLEGDLVAAEETANRALELGTASGQPDAFAYFGAQLLNVRVMQGRILEMVPLVEKVVQDNPGLAGFRATLVRAKSYDDDARGEVDSLLDMEVASNFLVPYDLSWLTAQVVWAEAAARSGHRPAAALLYDLLLPWYAQIATTHITVNGSVAHYLGCLAHALDRYDEADKWFAEALVCHEHMRAPYFIALTQTAWAAVLSDRDQTGDPDQAQRLIDAALPVATDRGYGYVERNARELIERMG